MSITLLLAGLALASLLLGLVHWRWAVVLLLAWMLVEGLLEIKVAVPKRTILGTGRGIFHQKRLVLYDEDECIVTATGSANETKSAWDHNGENLTVFKSWKAGNLEYITRHRDRFEALWNDIDPYVNVFTLPYAVEHKLRARAGCNFARASSINGLHAI